MYSTHPTLNTIHALAMPAPITRSTPQSLSPTHPSRLANGGLPRPPATQGTAPAQALPFKVDNPPLPLPVPTMPAQATAIAQPPPSHVIHSASDMVQEGRVRCH